jgi:hypothetical protein
MNTNNLIQEVKNKLTTQQKVELFKYLYKEIAGKGYWWRYRTCSY